MGARRQRGRYLRAGRPELAAVTDRAVASHGELWRTSLQVGLPCQKGNRALYVNFPSWYSEQRGWQEAGPVVRAVLHNTSRSRGIPGIQQMWCWRSIWVSHPDLKVGGKEILGMVWASKTSKPTHQWQQTSFSKAIPTPTSSVFCQTSKYMSLWGIYYSDHTPRPL